MTRDRIWSGQFLREAFRLKGFKAAWRMPLFSLFTFNQQVRKSARVLPCSVTLAP
jgi:hypothetical protein